MGVVLEMTKAFLDSQGYHYSEELDGEVLRLGIAGLNNIGTMEVIVVFDENDRTVSIKSFDICQIPESKKEQLYRICSELNERFRWVKFYVDESDNTITVQDDAVVSADTSGEEIAELVFRMCGITADAYPELMKALWG